MCKSKQKNPPVFFSNYYSYLKRKQKDRTYLLKLAEATEIPQGFIRGPPLHWVSPCWCHCPQFGLRELLGARFAKGHLSSRPASPKAWMPQRPLELISSQRRPPTLPHQPPALLSASPPPWPGAQAGSSLAVPCSLPTPTNFNLSPFWLVLAPEGLADPPPLSLHHHLPPHLGHSVAPACTPPSPSISFSAQLYDLCKT